MKKESGPKGKIVKLLLAVESDRWREFDSKEAAEIMGCDIRAVSTSLEAARKAGYLFVRKERGTLRIRGTAYQDQAAQDVQRSGTDRAIRSAKSGRVPAWATPADDPRIPKVVAGWCPPVMTPPRGAVQ